MDFINLKLILLEFNNTRFFLKACRLHTNVKVRIRFAFTDFVSFLGALPISHFYIFDLFTFCSCITILIFVLYIFI